MLSIREMHGCRVQTADNKSKGEVACLYLDRTRWQVMYAAAETEVNVQVLIPTRAIRGADLAARCLDVRLSEAEMLGRFAGPFRLPASVGSLEKNARSWLRYVSNQGIKPVSEIPPRRRFRITMKKGSRELSSSIDMLGYRIASGGAFRATLYDMLVDPMDWRIRFLVMTGEHTLRSVRVLLSPEAVERVEPAMRRLVLRAGDVPSVLMLPQAPSDLIQ